MYTRDELTAKTVPELYEICKALGISGMRKARKAVMIDAILNHTATNETTSESNSLGGVRATVNAVRNEDDNSVSALIRVSCGANRDTFPLVGKSVRDVMDLLNQILNIPAGAEAYVNGQVESYSYVLKEGDNLEFIRPAGSKG